MNRALITGGCQCGAIRFAIAGPLGRASICHCRMCQKAFGSFFGPLASAPGLRWTRGAPKYFRSSNAVRRGFCESCGTPLSFEPDGQDVEISIGSLDRPSEAPPVVQLALTNRLPWVGDLTGLPCETATEAKAAADAGIISFQHPDHDTFTWPPP